MSSSLQELTSMKSALHDEADRLRREVKSASHGSRLIAVGLKMREVEKQIEDLSRKESNGQ